MEKKRVSELEDTEYAFRTNRQLLGNVFESMQEGVLVLDRNFKYTHINRTLEEISRTPKEEIFGKIPWEKFPFLKGEIEETMKKAMRGEVIRNIELKYTLSDGKEGWTTESYFPLKDSEENIVGVVGVIDDITERKQAEAALKKLNHTLNARNEELMDFIHFASHDFQAPLRKVSVFSERLSLEVQGLNEKGAHFLKRLQHSVKRMQDLMNDLVNYSRVVSLDKSSIKAVDLNGAIQDVVLDFELELNETNGKIEVGPLPIIKADDFQIRGLFHNLISNSLKYHKNDIAPQIEIKGKISNVKPGYFEISVEDNGIGFDEKYISRIFKPFKRLHRDDEYKGTGMGLTLCKKIVERLKGFIEVKSTINKGTIFIIYLPLKNQETL